jgi:hypothetical protein
MTKSNNTSAGSSGTSHERGERVLAKIAAQWSKNNKSISAAVTAAESSNDPRHPSRFEKKKNMGLAATGQDAARP